MRYIINMKNNLDIIQGVYVFDVKGAYSGTLYEGTEEAPQALQEKVRWNPGALKWNLTGHRAEVVDITTEGGLDLSIFNSQWKEKMTMTEKGDLVMLATKLRNHEVVEYLLLHGFSPNPRDSRNETPLHVAVKDDDIKMAKLLMDFGADISNKDDWGKTPIDKVHSAEMAELLNVTPHKNLVLIRHGQVVLEAGLRHIEDDMPQVLWMKPQLARTPILLWDEMKHVAIHVLHGIGWLDPPPGWAAIIL